MPRRILCKFFAKGACLRGEHCEFSHDWKDPPDNICKYFQRGMCYRNRCRYDHVKVSRLHPSAPSSSTAPRPPSATASAQACSSKTISNSIVAAPPGLAESSTSTPSKRFWNFDAVHNDQSELSQILEPRSCKPEDQPICSFAATGDCPRGDQCPHIHGDLCLTCGKCCLHPFRPEEREEHKKFCEKMLDTLKLSQDIECNICLERVLSKTTSTERKFGLLTECDHPFCISCIRNWRSSSPTSGMEVKTCPVCRKLSYFVVPSVIWYSTPEEKKEIIENYKAKLRFIDCKHFNFGNGNCPFGTSCFYKHTVEPGSYTWKYRCPPPRQPRPRRSSNRSNEFDVSEIFDMLEDIIPEDCFDPFGFEGLNDDDDDDDLSPLQLAMLLMHVGEEFDPVSSDDEADDPF